MKPKYLSFIAAIAMVSVFVPAQQGLALVAEGPNQISDGPVGFSPLASDCMGNAGSQIASSFDGERLVLSDVSRYMDCNSNTQLQDQRVWLSSDSGRTWSDSGLGIDYWGPVASSADGRYLAAASAGSSQSPGGSLWLSSDFGVTWTESISVDPEVNTDTHDHLWWDLDISSDGRVIIATSDGESAVHLSTDYGQTWRIITHAPGEDPSASPALSWRGAAVSGDGSSAVICRNDPQTPEFFAIDIDSVSSGADPELEEVQYSANINPALTVCGSIDMDESGLTFITGSFWTQWISVFKKSEGVWNQTTSHDFANDGVNNVQVSSDGETLMVSFYQSVNVAISQDSGENWVYFKTSQNAGSIAAISGDGNYLIAHDYQTGFHAGTLSQQKQGVPNGQNLMVMDYYTDEFAFDISGGAMVGRTGTISNLPDDTRSEGGDWDSVSGKQYVLYYGCSVAELDPMTGELTSMQSLNQALIDSNATDCWSFTTTTPGRALMGTGAGVIEIDLENQEVMTEPVGPANTAALAYHSQSGEVWIFPDASSGGVLDLSTGNYEQRIVMSEIAANRVVNKSLSSLGVWSADFDGNGLLWTSAWNSDDNALIVSFDPYADNVAASLEFYGPVLGQQSDLSSDAIWFTGQAIPIPVEEQPTDPLPAPIPDSPQSAQRVFIPQVSNVVEVAAGELLISGRRLDSVISVELSGQGAQILSLTDSDLRLKFRVVDLQTLELTLTGPFGRLTIIGLQVAKSSALQHQEQTQMDSLPPLRKHLFRSKVVEGSLVISTEEVELQRLAGIKAGTVTCTGFMTANLGNATKHWEAKTRARLVCNRLKNLNPNLSVVVNIDRKQFFGRSVRVVVSEE